MAQELAHRILSDLSTAFQRHPNIDEVGFIPCPTCQHNRSPVVVENNKLGIETWCLELIFPYAHDKVLRARGRDDNGRKIKVSRSARSLLEATRAVLLVQADCLTAWNIRKELVEAEDLKCIQDLKFAALVLTKHPKSSETFAHRRWLLKQIVQKTTSTSLQPSPVSQASHTNGLVAGDQASGGAAAVPPLNARGTKSGGAELPCDEKLLETELAVCQSSAERYPSNYYAWTHRAWVVEQVARCHYKILIKELSDTRHWISRHISDHSGLQYRQFLITQLATHFRSADALQDEFLPLLTAEFELLTDLITAFPGHEALWYHRRYVFQQWESVLSMCKCPKSDNSASSTGKNQTHLQQGHPEVPAELYAHSASSFSRDCKDSKLHATVVQGNKKAKVDPAYTEHHTLQSELELCRNVMATCRDGWQVRLAGSYQHWLQQRILGQDNTSL
ncbi:PREDICTED: LOW QUALITY PROTEIN: protein prenyltransferase alpha subunit repeat-containing protein 1-like [Branchiostoma belcheri]|uniref:LOW QUALITY PROTEIN: protein prenyltransferase alpha subunit repeat-containing protein 1-like n=1 Tax=Branchiostoma belcheri TaxID=7741 RepID=A0A6P4YIB3_BRABE|nr:PREDICTED: LOW QUALITY PROTEIN: protein prenyltransferase alpha subunit repeat-containing protein 1-like [Branchiostoma belcheri]KAI8481756.1 Protein prenyltransferase alpha subunit repeat-containing protein 1 [Branchiostoma belcheri]